MADSTSSSTRGVGIRCGVNWSLLERRFFWAPPLVVAGDRKGCGFETGVLLSCATGLLWLWLL